MKRYKETRLSEFFSKKSKADECRNADNQRVESQTLATETETETSAPLVTAAGGITVSGTGSAANDETHPNDFGLAIGHKLSDADKVRFLTNLYTPPESYAWPTATRVDRGKTITCRLDRSKLLKHSCLAYSPKLNGVFCIYCSIFAADEVGRAKVQTGVFVNAPFRRYTHWSAEVAEHLSRMYHADSATKPEAFIASMRDPNKDITVQLDVAAGRQVNENRQVLVPIIESIIFLARCGIPLRGHRDSGRISCIETCADVQGDQGNFRALLQFKAASGDEVLSRHLKSAPGNALYVSPTVQADLIGSIGYVILRNVVDEINAAGYFSVMADETTDVAGHEQLTVVIRYVFDNNIREQFIGFARADDLTGEGLAKQILDTLRQAGINCGKMIRQGYDGASSMAGSARGVQAVIRQSYPAACYTHCAAHALNLTISKASEVQAIRNAFGVMCETVTFFRLSPKRSTQLEQRIVDSQSNDDPRVKSQKTHLKKLCDTRWVERHEAVKTFTLLYLPVVDTLNSISQSRDASSATASSLLASISRSEFVVAMIVLKHVLAITKQLSISLQEVN